MQNTTKKVWTLAAALVTAAALGACADQPLAPQEEAYEVQMDGQGDGSGKCVIVNGVVYCS